MPRAPPKKAATKAATSPKKPTRPPSTRIKEKKAEPEKKVQKKETAPKKSPKKSASAKGTKKSTPRKHKPSYLRMVQKCLKASGESYVSAIAIMKYVESNFPVAEGFKRYVKQALKKGVEEGELVKVRGSFRLSAKASRRMSRSTSTGPKKSKSSSSSAKKEKTSKKRSRSESPSSPKKKAKKESTEKKAKPKSPKKKPEEKKEKKPKEKKEKKEGEKKEGEKEKPSSTKKTSRSSKKEATADKGKEKEKEKEQSGDEAVSLPNAKYDFVWQYDENGAWKNYDAEASDTVEEVFLKYKENRGDTDVRAVKSGQWEYMVDFMAMKQTNIQHENHTTRKIRRVPRRK